MCYVTPDYPSDSSRTRHYPKDKHKFCNGPGNFTCFSAKGSSDSDGAKRPTFPLDIKTFSAIAITDFHEIGFDSQSSSPRQHSETIPSGSRHGFTKSHTCVISRSSKSSTNNLYTHSGMERESVQYPLQKQSGQEIWDVASPPRSYSSVSVFSVEISVGQFLRACCLCKRKLNHGKDIYMYRGDKAFCSVECCYQQILMDDVDG